MPKRLPPELRYLQPVFRDLAKPGRRVDEDYDTSMLLAALAERLAGLRKAGAERLLAADGEALEAWLQGQPQHPGWFVSAFLQSPGVVALAREAAVPAGERMSPFGVPMPKVAVPPGYKLRTERGSLTVHKRSAAIVVVPMPAQELDGFKQLMVGEGAVMAAFTVGSVSGSAWSTMGGTTYAFGNARSAFAVTVSNPDAVTRAELRLVLESLAAPVT